MLSVVVSMDGSKGMLIAKGAVEEVLSRCVRAVGTTNLDPSVKSSSNALASLLADAPILDESTRTSILRTAETLNEQGLRLVAVAQRPFPAYRDCILSSADENELVFVGFCAFLDPAKADAADAIKLLRVQGVEVSTSLVLFDAVRG